MAALQRIPSSPPLTTEIYGPTVEPQDIELLIPRISYGLPFTEAVLRHLSPSARVFVIASKTLAAKTQHLSRLRDALGNHLVGVQVGMTPHTLFSETIAIAKAAKKAGADTIVTLGAGSISDAAKFICVAPDEPELSSYHNIDELAAAMTTITGKGRGGGDELLRKPVILRKPWAELIMIPTSLSAGEHTHMSGLTDDASGKKVLVPSSRAKVTILDPWLGCDTPLDIWMQSGVRGIDHCVEVLCALRGTFDEADATAERGLRLLVPGLLATRKEEEERQKRSDEDGKPKPRNAGARLDAQVGVSLAMLPLLWRVPVGASHGIGHMLGPLGVGHGETSCILLPAVCRYNISANAHRQAKVRDIFWTIPECKALFRQRGLSKDTADLADLLDIIIRELGMPRTLREKGIVGKAKLETLAEHSLHDPFLMLNPRPIDTVEQVMEILEAVQG